MSVVSHKELPQTFEREVGRPAIIKRRFVCVLSDNTLENQPPTEVQIVAAVLGITEQQAETAPIFGAQHPRIPSWKLRKFWLNEGYEGSPYHVEVVLEYGIVRDEEILHPTLRPSVWGVEGSQAEVPALYYYAATGNATMYPLTNSAFDFYPGLMTEEAVARISIKRNFATFPSSWMGAMNSVNNAAYFGMATHTAKVAAVSTSYAYEEFGSAVVNYWDTTATIAFRQSGHNLQLPDVGYNFISGGQKRRAMVFDFQNSEWVPSPTPVGLNGGGGLSEGNPEVLNRRVNPETNFQTLFGTPPS